MRVIYMMLDADLSAGKARLDPKHDPVHEYHLTLKHPENATSSYAKCSNPSIYTQDDLFS